MRNGYAPKYKVCVAQENRLVYILYCAALNRNSNLFKCPAFFRCYFRKNVGSRKVNAADLNTFVFIHDKVEWVHYLFFSI